MSRALIAGLTAVVVAMPLAAQDAMVGTWRVTYPAGTRIENGEQSAIMGTGRLRIVTRGDSLVGEFVADPVPDLPARGPTRLVGRAGQGRVALVAHQAVFVEVNGEQRPVRFSSTWEMEAKGDSLLGTLSHHVDDPTVSAQPPGPVRGIRQRP